jgi:hypothetical protein
VYNGDIRVSIILDDLTPLIPLSLKGEEEEKKGG